MRLAGGLLALLLLTLSGARARAYSDPALFDAAPELAGGGGRLFTGSPQDGHSCSVCHVGGEAPRVELSGLPDEFEPGKLYQIGLRWDGQAASHALHVELVTKAGAHPKVLLEPDSVLGADGRCDADPEGEPAYYGIDRDARRIVGVRDCGASRVSLQFTGPTEGDEVYFAASIVRTDSSGTAKGDGVLDLRRRVRRKGSVSGDGCSLRRGDSLDVAPWLLMLLLWSLSAARSRAAAWPPERAHGSSPGTPGSESAPGWPGHRA
ncbi:MAG TPA: hypothetical protein VJU61_04030 [Polyangiaceae bacterium]|nr:hypothetical protein [Polyangiaceae bacterium]